MRTITLNIYKYNELPTEEAKTKARGRWYGLEMSNPACMHDHFKSRDAACLAVADGLKPSELIKQSGSCAWTGYYADGILADYIKETKRVPTEDEIYYIYTITWQDELQSKNSRGYIEECIEENEYEFFEDGSFYEGDE